ncbi:MAG: PorT family protein [Paludibacteraceae bacterium]|nr:PorT family protein [Paludibacteraceae bacterium]HNZ61713.1 porin family protein [Paludibacteraceae bacterium]
MKKKICLLGCFLFFFVIDLFSQFSIQGGINRASEIYVENSASETNLLALKNLTGYNIGILYQTPQNGWGIATGISLSQKGSIINSDSLTDVYRQFSYLEIPLHVRYSFCFGDIGLFGFGGVYGAYALNGQKISETLESRSKENFTYPDFKNHIDYGYTFGAGIQFFKKIQIQATWNQGLKNLTNYLNGEKEVFSTKNKIFSVNLSYLF